MTIARRDEVLIAAGVPAQHPDAIVAGCETIVVAMSASLKGTLIVHRGHMPEIQFETNEVVT